MSKKRMVQRVAALALCATLASYSLDWLTPRVHAAGTSSTVYTFGDASGSWPDLAAEHKQEAKQREKECKKAEKERKKAEKAAKKKAAKEAREREKREKAAKKNTEKASAQSVA